MIRSARLTLLTVGVPLVGACSAPSDLNWIHCDPNAPLLEESEVCSAEADAGSDAASDAGSDAPGPTPQANTCQGSCVPVPDKNNAGHWTEIPLAVWIGPPSAAPAECPPGPGGVPNEKFRLFTELDAPPAECEPCECGPSEGTCAGLPETIEVRAGACNEVGASALPFDGPAGWDGSCTSANAVPTGKQCGGEPCAQSVWASKLPAPTNESCVPKVATPSFKAKTEWNLRVLACMANANEDACGEKVEGAYCVNEPGPGWLHCVYREGVHEQCPANYNARWTAYPEKPIDDRGCEACMCGEAVGGQCGGSLRVYSDAACSSQSEQVGLSSSKPACVDVIPEGHAMAAKAILDISYTPGTCAATGGTPKGAAFPNPDPLDAVTFCCLGQFWEIK